jgi:hypothetical protein
MGGAEETLQRIEELLALLLESIRRLERRLDSLGLTEEASVAYELTSLFSLPTSAAIEAAKKLLSVLARHRLDPISREIVKVLSTCEEMNISELTRAVRAVRGSASRGVVRRKLKVLEAIGAVVNSGTEQRPRYVLRDCLEREAGTGG